MNPKSCVWIGVLCLVSAVCGWGAEEAIRVDDKPTIYVGTGAIVSSQPYVGADTRTYVVPMFGYEGKRLYMRGIMGGYRVYSKGGFSIGPIIQPSFEGYEEEDSPALQGMDDRDWSIDAGVGAFWRTDIGLFGLSCVTDILGEHDGQTLEFSYTLRFPLAGFDVIPSAGVRWESEDRVDYYYGVRSDEAVLPSRPPYEASSAINPFVRLAVRRKLTERWTLLTALQYEWLDDEIGDSPIVDEHYDASVVLGVLYSW